ncbi:MAG: 4Fe-4S cluster-binding domain-containing protein, partial [Bacilli bacterium]|nr:4Fe-4S cluster-binding domain-containing protein [Bacilli bacterium]
MIKGSVNSIETMGLVDGPGIRTVVFFNSCLLRCKYCHNPETWKMGNKNMTVEELVGKVLRNKPYFKNNGGVTFSGGEPLLQDEFLLECCKRLKEENIHIAIDTAGYTPNNVDEILKYVDLVLLDIK